MSESGTSVLSPRPPCSPVLHPKVAGPCCAPLSWCACILGGRCWDLPQPPSVTEGMASQAPPRVGRMDQVNESSSTPQSLQALAAPAATGCGDDACQVWAPLLTAPCSLPTQRPEDPQSSQASILASSNLLFLGTSHQWLPSSWGPSCAPRGQGVPLVTGNKNLQEVRPAGGTPGPFCFSSTGTEGAHDGSSPHRGNVVTALLGGLQGDSVSPGVEGM